MAGFTFTDPTLEKEKPENLIEPRGVTPTEEAIPIEPRVETPKSGFTFMDDPSASLPISSPSGFTFSEHNSSLTPDPEEIVTDPLERYKDKSLSKKEILEDKDLMSIIRDSQIARYGEQSIEGLDDNDLFEQWQNHQRMFAGGNSVTTLRELAWHQMSEEDARVKVGKGYLLFDKMPNAVFSSNSTWAETFDSLGDYAYAAIVDPSTVIGVGVGRAVGAGSSKAAALALKQGVKQLVSTSASRTAAAQVKKKVARTAMLSTFKKDMAAAALVDLPFALGADVAYQNSMMWGKAQDEFSVAQTAISSIGALVAPSVLYGLKGVAKAGKTALSDKVGMGSYLERLQQVGVNKSSANIQQVVIDNTDLKYVEQKLGNLVADLIENPHRAGDWKLDVGEGKQVADALGSMDIRTPDLDLFSALLMGNEAAGVDGLGPILRKSGFVFIPRHEGDNITNFIGDIIARLDDQQVKDWMTQLGDDRFKDMGAIELSKYFKARGSNLGTGLGQLGALSRTLNSDTTMEEAMKAVKKDQGKKTIQFTQSIWKRLVTSHPATTAANVKGWAIASAAGSVSDVVEGVLLSTAGVATLNPKLMKEGTGSILGGLRRGWNTLNFLDTAESAKAYFELKPDIDKALRRYITGDVDQGENLAKLYGFDPKDKLSARTDKFATFMQNASGVKLQDEITKQISFMSAVDQEIMKEYGYGLNRFMQRPDAYTEMFSERYKLAEDKALNRTMKETFGFKYGRNTTGKGVARHTAAWVEEFSNYPGIGFLIPFGQFFNNSIAFLGDYSGLNLMYHVAKRVAKANIDPTEERGMQLIAKAAVGIGALTAYFLPKAQEKLEQGLRWNQEMDSNGQIQDITYDAPLPYATIVAQMLAHYKKDGKVPTDLWAEFGGQVVGQTVRQFDDFFKGIYELISTDAGGGGVMELVSRAISQVGSGFTRPLDPINQMVGIIRGDHELVDRRQGVKAYNEALRYVDNFLPTIEGVTATEPRRSPTSEQPPNDIGKALGGSRVQPGVSPSEQMLASIGKSPWKAVMWKGDYPELKNYMDGLIEPIINREAKRLISETDFFNQSLQKREAIVSKMVEDAKKEVKEVLGSGILPIDKVPEKLSAIYGYSAKDRRRAMKRLGIDDMSLGDIAAMDDGPQKLDLILELLQNQSEYLGLDP